MPTSVDCQEEGSAVLSVPEAKLVTGAMDNSKYVNVSGAMDNS